jgi:hypothetical protein
MRLFVRGKREIEGNEYKDLYCAQISLTFVDRYKYERRLASHPVTVRDGEEGQAIAHEERTQ